MDFLVDIDTWLLLAINGFNNGFLDPFMKAFSGRFPWIFLYVSIAAVMWWKYGWRRALAMMIATGIAVGLSDFICASVIRSAVCRLRPSNPENAVSAMVHVVDNYRPDSYGFPSCHACNTPALATITVLWLRERRYTIFIFCWSALQCYSRIYLGVHYPGDILVGAIIGTAISLAIYHAALPVLRHIEDIPNPKATTIPAIVVGVVTTIVLFFCA